MVNLIDAARAITRIEAMLWDICPKIAVSATVSPDNHRYEVATKAQPVIGLDSFGFFISADQKRELFKLVIKQYDRNHDKEVNT